MELKPGAKLGPYEIVSAIGEGGMGEVWKARDTRLDRDVAMKVLKTEFSDRFEREARSVAALNHPNICQIYDVGPDYLVMEYIEGAPVAPVDSMRKLLDIAVQLSDGLTAAHTAKIIHRDLKPDNIFITPDRRRRHRIVIWINDFVWQHVRIAPPRRSPRICARGVGRDCRCPGGERRPLYRSSRGVCRPRGVHADGGDAARSQHRQMVSGW